MTILTELMRIPKELIEVILLKIEDEEELVKVCSAVSYPRFRGILESFSFQERFARIKSRVGKFEQGFVAGGYDKTWKFSSVDFSNFNSRILSPSPLKLKLDNHLHYCNGLVASGSSRLCSILNPYNGFSRTLPLLSEKHGKVGTFLGFSNSGHYKIIGMHTEREKGFTNYCVLTLGQEREEEWRSVECKFPHFPQTRALCSKGIVYYTATISRKDIHFDLDTLKFGSNVIPEPWKFGFLRPEADPFEIDGKISVSFLGNNGRHHNIWMLEDAISNVWSLLKVDEPSALENEKVLRFHGLFGSGNMVFTRQEMNNLVMFVHKKETNVVERSVLEGVGGCINLVFFNAVGSLMFY